MDAEALEPFRLALEAAAQAYDPAASVRNARIRNERDAYVFELCRGDAKLAVIDYDRDFVEDFLGQIVAALRGR